MYNNFELDGWQHETQILTWVLSYDKVHSPEALSICSASAAMCISEVSQERNKRWRNCIETLFDYVFCFIILWA